MLAEQMAMVEETGVSITIDGVPTYEDYKGLRDMVSGYTDGHLLMTSWRWNSGAVTPGQSAGLCIGNPEDADTFWSCWEYPMEDGGNYADMPRSYLIDPTQFKEGSRLEDFTDLTGEAFPAMFGGWLCLPPMTYDNGTFSNCARFLPDEEYSKQEDFKFKEGPVKVMTYLSSRADGPALANGNNSTTIETGMLQSFIVNLSESSGLSGVSAAALALVAAVSALSF